MMIFLRGKLLDFIVLDKTYAILADIHTLMVTDAGAKAKYEVNAKAVDHLVRSLCDSEFERVCHLNLAWEIWEKLLVLTPKFGKESDLWDQLDEESVWRRKISSDVFGRKIRGRLSAFDRKENSWADFAGLYGDVAQAGRANGWISDQA
jgi:hypothetical protein